MTDEFVRKHHNFHESSGKHFAHSHNSFLLLTDVS